MKEIERLQAELRELEKSFEQGGAKIEACMKATGSATAAELKDKAENYRYFLDMKHDIEEERKRILRIPASVAALQEEYAKQEQEARELEQAAAALAAQRGGHATAFGRTSNGSRPSWPTGVLGTRRRAGIRRGFRFCRAEPAGRRGRFHDGDRHREQDRRHRDGDADPGGRGGGSAQSDHGHRRKYVRIEAGHDGDPIVHAKDDSVVQFLGTEPRHAGTWSISVSGPGLSKRWPASGDCRFCLTIRSQVSIPADSRPRCQILRALGTKTQVILFTSNPALRAAGDAAAELK